MCGSGLAATALPMKRPIAAASSFSPPEDPEALGLGPDTTVLGLLPGLAPPLRWRSAKVLPWFAASTAGRSPGVAVRDVPLSAPAPRGTMLPRG